MTTEQLEKANVLRHRIDYIERSLNNGGSGTMFTTFFDCSSGHVQKQIFLLLKGGLEALKEQAEKELTDL